MTPTTEWPTQTKRGMTRRKKWLLAFAAVPLTFGLPISEALHGDSVQDRLAPAVVLFIIGSVLVLPFWLLAGAIRQIPEQIRDERRAAGLCSRCGYDLTGNLSGICPECGEKVSR